MKTITSPKPRISMKRPLSRVAGILPFTQKPSNNHFDVKEENSNDEMKASDLFSLFTADIIKEEVIFTR